MNKRKKTKCYCLPGTQEVYVLYSSDWSEIDIHARVLMKVGVCCESLPGITVKSEVGIYIKNKYCRIDIMIFKGMLPLCGIEVKKHNSTTNPAQQAKQSALYKAFEKFTGIPIYYCNGFKDIKPITSKVINYVYRQYLPKKCEVKQ